MTVDEAYKHLIDTYLASHHRKHVERINKAFNFARQAHEGVKRLSGEPYIMHPIAVAQIASEEMGLGSTSICAALLHDVVEDTDYSIEDIRNLFGDKIAQIVDGLTKISGGIFGDHASEQTENFKKLLLTMSDDIRVILIKICDRLHNMRTLAAQPAGKQYKIAGETLYIYAPLANRLGLNKIKTELENLSFRFEHPETYEAISRKLQITQDKRDQLFDDFTQPIRHELGQMGIRYSIKARVKSPYSIWHKMQKKGVTFEQIYDILAVRIVFDVPEGGDEIAECFQIYVAVSKLYKAHPDRLRDWLNHPKANGYQALHVTLMSHMGRWIEVQIRSRRMDDTAENGFAAHWKYKEDKGEANKDGELNNWIGTIKEILDDPQPDAIDFLDTIKLNLFASEIFVFTPKGEIITMPAGCTALDFAFHIHSFLGSHCIGAKVNHKLVPLSHQLEGGDQVEVITSQTQHVRSEWLSFVTTAKARTKIQIALRKEMRDQQKLGEQRLQEFLRSKDLEMTSQAISNILNVLSLKRPDELFQKIGSGAVPLDSALLEATKGLRRQKRRRSWRRYVPFLREKAAPEVSAPNKLVIDKSFNLKQTIFITEQNFSEFNLPESCCHPIPGDDVLGFIDSNNQIIIHQRSCEVANVLKTSYGNRILDLRWNMHSQMLFEAEIIIDGIDRKGIIFDVSRVLTQDLDVNILHLSISTENHVFHGTLSVLVHNSDEVRDIQNALKKIPGIQ